MNCNNSETITINGYNAAIDTAAAEDVWHLGATYGAERTTLGTFTISSADVDDKLVGDKATGTVTIGTYTGLTGDTVTVNGVVLTEGVHWTAATSNDATATSLAAAVTTATASTGTTAAAVAAVVTVTANTAGTAGNAITLAISDAVNSSKSGATLASGTDGGTGARTVLVKYIGTDYREFEETVSLAGRTGVALANQAYAVNTIEVLTAGSSASNEGIIYAGTGTVTTGVPAVIHCAMGVGHNKSSGARYTVRKDTNLHITGLNYSVLGTAGAVFSFRVHDIATGLVTVTRFTQATYDISMPDAHTHIEAGQTLTIRATVGANSTAVSCIVHGYLGD